MSSDIYRDRRPGENVITWAKETRRISAAQAEEWQVQVDRGELPISAIQHVAEAMVPGCVGGAPPVRVSASAFTAPPGVHPGWYAANPAVDQFMAKMGPLTVRASATKEKPTLFESGDLPPFTASGIDPAVLATVPWPYRHPIASTPNRDEAYSLIELGRSESGLDAAREFLAHAGNRDYEHRCTQWALDAGTEAGRQQQEAEDRRQVAAAVGKSVAEMNNDEMYEYLFGAADRRREQAQIEHEEQVLAGKTVLNYHTREQIEAMRARKALRAAAARENRR